MGVRGSVAGLTILLTCARSMPSCSSSDGPSFTARSRIYVLDHLGFRLVGHQMPALDVIVQRGIQLVHMTFRLLAVLLSWMR